MFLFVTLPLVFYFAAPKVLACHPNPTNYLAFASVQKSDGTQYPTSPQPKPTFLIPLIVAAIGIAVVGYILWQIVKMCQKIPPPNPPDPPPDGSLTNGPPITINPTTGPGPADAFTTPISTNSDWGTIGYYDISKWNYMDPIAKTPYLWFWSTGMLTSTNLSDWEDTHYRIDAYTSGAGVLFAYYHFGTNFSNQYFTSPTNARCWFNLTDKPYRPVQFFKLDPKS